MKRDKGKNDDKLKWQVLMKEARNSHANFGAALDYANQALDLAEVTFGSHDQKVADTLQFMAGLYYSSEQYDKAEPFFNRCIHLYGLHSPQVNNLLATLVDLYTKLEQPKIAAKYAKLIKRD